MSSSLSIIPTSALCRSGHTEAALTPAAAGSLAASARYGVSVAAMAIVAVGFEPSRRTLRGWSTAGHIDRPRCRTTCSRTSRRLPDCRNRRCRRRCARLASWLRGWAPPAFRCGWCRWPDETRRGSSGERRRAAVAQPRRGTGAGAWPSRAPTGVGGAGGAGASGQVAVRLVS
jgi:hypothetical protein